MNILFIAALSAFAGAYLGSKLLKKVTLKFIQYTVGIMILVLAVGLGLGLL
jgi:uncharacterized protein